MRGEWGRSLLFSFFLVFVPTGEQKEGLTIGGTTDIYGWTTVLEIYNDDDFYTNKYAVKSHLPRPWLFQVRMHFVTAPRLSSVRGSVAVADPTSY
jgi:hypothetical protein